MLGVPCGVDIPQIEVGIVQVREQTREMYEAVLQAFREAPANCLRVKVKTGIDNRTAKRLWEIGWPGKLRRFGYGKPIKLVLSEEQELARAARISAMEAQAKAEEDRSLQAQKDGIETLKEEGLLTKMGRIMAIGIGRGFIDALKGFGELAKQIEADMKNSASMTPLERASMLRLIAQAGLAAERTNQLALQNERVRLGEPTQVFGVKVDRLTAEEAANELRHLVSTIGDTGDERATH